MHQWLRVVKSAGVDLRLYGNKENQLLRGSSRHWDNGRIDGAAEGMRQDFQAWYYTKQSLPWYGERPARYTIRLIGVKIGLEVEGWDIITGERTDEFAGDFWELMESPPLRVPGSWVDDLDAEELYGRGPFSYRDPK
jgi:hypothetical protein